MSTQDNGRNPTIRITPEQKLGKDIWGLILNYLATGGTNEFVYGLLHSLQTVVFAPAELNARRQAEAMLEAQSQLPKE